ncbi:MAG: hypothetical protein ACLR56_12800 [Oscillospiraceae bacterium]
MIIYNAEINGELKTVITEGGKIISVEETEKTAILTPRATALYRLSMCIPTPHRWDTMDDFEPMCRFMSTANLLSAHQ